MLSKALYVREICRREEEHSTNHTYRTIEAAQTRNFAAGV